MDSLPRFYSCKKKYQARFQTIIEMYRHYFGRKMPLNRQYWTMCGLNSDDNGNLQKQSELGQMLESGLIIPKQFCGVDINKETISLNKMADKNAHWFNKDFVSQMKIAKKEGWFTPSLINADLINLPQKGVQKIAEIMSFITDCDINNVLLVGNLMLTNPHAKIQISEIEAYRRAKAVPLLLSKQIAFKYAWNSRQWKNYPQCYVYKGTGRKSHTYLATYIFVKK